MPRSVCGPLLCFASRRRAFRGGEDKHDNESAAHPAQRRQPVPAGARASRRRSPVDATRSGPASRGARVARPVRGVGDRLHTRRKKRGPCRRQVPRIFDRKRPRPPGMGPDRQRHGVSDYGGRITDHVRGQCGRPFFRDQISAVHRRRALDIRIRAYQASVHRARPERCVLHGVHAATAQACHPRPMGRGQGPVYSCRSEQHSGESRNPPDCQRRQVRRPNQFPFAMAVRAIREVEFQVEARKGIGSATTAIASRIDQNCFETASA